MKIFQHVKQMTELLPFNIDLNKVTFKIVVYLLFFMDIHICQSLLNCVFMCILLYVNYTSIKLSKNIGGNSMPFCPLEHLFIVL